MRIAVIGAGQFGRRHIATVQSSPGCELAAVADPAYSGDKAYADYRRMLDEARPDGVIIAAPNALHAPIGLAFVERRVAMLVEKPVADTLAAARRLVSAADEERVPLLVGHYRRHNPLLEKARELVQDGALGRLVAVAALWLLQKPGDYYEVAWRREPGGGPLLINCIHDVDDLRFANGALGTVTVSDTAAAPWAWELTSGEYEFYPRQDENCYFFTGTEASLERRRRHPHPGGGRRDSRDGIALNLRSC